MSDAPLARRSLLQYSIMALPLAFAGIPIYIHAPDFYATEYGLSLALTGSLLLLLRLIDAVQDPIIGRLSDTYAHHRLKIIVGSVLFLVIGFTALFNPVTSDSTLWFALTMFVATTAYSILSINLNSIGGLWSKDHHQKTRITSHREALGLIGLILAVMLPSILQQSMHITQAFAWVCAVLFFVALLATMLFVPWYRSHTSLFGHTTPHVHTSFISVLITMPAATRRFFYVYGISTLASSIPAILILFFVRDSLHAEEYTGFFLALYFIAAALTMPLWQYLSKRCGKPQAWMVAMMLAIVSFIWAFFLGAGDIVPFAIICVGSGMAFGADLALPPSILADLIQSHNTQNTTAFQFSVMGFLLKTSLAIASASAFAALDAVNFIPAQENSESALWWLSTIYALIPCLIKIGAVILLWASLKHFTTTKYPYSNALPDRSRTYAK